MTRYLWITDTHDHQWTAFATGQGVENSRLKRSNRVIDEAVDFCLQKGITEVIHGGDVFHSRVVNRYECFNPTYEKYRRFKENGIRLRIQRGNHDDVTKDGSTTTIDSFVDIAEVIKTPTVCVEEGIAFLPYSSDSEWIRQWLRDFPDPQNYILLAHIDVLGAEAGLNWISDKGIDREELAKFKLVLMGHYHKCQQLAPNVFYTGCSIPQDFTEINQPGRMLIFDTDGRMEWYTTSAPKFVVWNPNFTEIIPTGDQDPLYNSYVKVLAEPNPGIDDILKQRGAVGWIYKPEKKAVQTKQREGNISAGADLNSVVRTYATLHCGTLPLDQLISVGNSLLLE